MRDNQRIEGYDISLDRRQVVSLVATVVVVVGGAFILGVIVGKRLSSTPRDVQQVDVLTQLDRRAAPATPPATLAFPTELTKPAPAIRETPPKVVAASTALAEPKAPSTTVVSPPEPTAKAVLANAPPPEKVVAPVAPAPSTAASDAALLAAVKSVAIAPGAAVPAVAKPSNAAGPWTLQVASHQTKAQADKQLAALIAKGIRAYMVEATVGGRGTWYRVRVGHFASREAATHYLDEFKRANSMSAIVIHD